MKPYPRPYRASLTFYHIPASQPFKFKWIAWAIMAALSFAAAAYLGATIIFNLQNLI